VDHVPLFSATIFSSEVLVAVTRVVARLLEHHPHLPELVPSRLRPVAEVDEGYPLQPE
jgi:hypothetical protein